MNSFFGDSCGKSGVLFGTVSAFSEEGGTFPAFLDVAQGCAQSLAVLPRIARPEAGAWLKTVRLSY